jgi:starch synthase (maltosyl-transferring)
LSAQPAYVIVKYYNSTFAERGRCRVVIENVAPEIEAGRFPIKRVIEERVVVEADIFADGHDSLSAVLKFRAEENSEWSETPMVSLANDRWRGEFVTTKLGNYFYTIEAWVDQFKSWQADLQKKLEAKLDVSIEMRTGAKLIEAAAQRATSRDAENLLSWAKELSTGESVTGDPIARRALNQDLTEMACRYLGRQFSTSYEKELPVAVDPERARFSAWYEMFPRSFAPEVGKHGTFRECELQLPRIAKMGFDILYLPPIHPIGKSVRKGKNNNVVCGPGEPGSPCIASPNSASRKATIISRGEIQKTSWNIISLSSRNRRLRIFFIRIFGQTRRTYSRNFCRQVVAMRSRFVLFSRRRSARVTAFTARHSSFARTRRASRAARNTSIPKNTKSSAGICPRHKAWKI